VCVCVCVCVCVLVASLAISMPFERNYFEEKLNINIECTCIAYSKYFCNVINGKYYQYYQDNGSDLPAG